MAWIESHQSLGGHLKLRRLARTLRVHGAQAIGHLHYLWWWALDGAPTGDLSGLTHEEIAELAEWPGDPDAFVAALKACGWLDPNGHLHDWEEYGGRLTRKREANRERQCHWRQRQRDGPAPEKGVTRYVTPPSRVSHGATVQSIRRQKDPHSEEREPLWPSLEDCHRVAQTRDVPKDCAEKWWHEHDARGGRDRHGQPLFRWESALLAYGAAWRANEERAKKIHENRSRSVEVRPNRNAGTYNQAVVGQYANCPRIIRA